MIWERDRAEKRSKVGSDYFTNDIINVLKEHQKKNCLIEYFLSQRESLTSRLNVHLMGWLWDVGHMGEINKTHHKNVFIIVENCNFLESAFALSTAVDLVRNLHLVLKLIAKKWLKWNERREWTRRQLFKKRSKRTSEGHQRKLVGRIINRRWSPTKQSHHMSTVTVCIVGLFNDKWRGLLWKTMMISLCA